MKKDDEPAFESLEEVGDFFGKMMEKLQTDFPFLESSQSEGGLNIQRETDGNVIHVDFNKGED